MDDDELGSGRYFGAEDNSRPLNHNFARTMASRALSSPLHGRLLYVEDASLGADEGNIVDLGGRDAGPPPTDDMLSEDDMTARRQQHG